MPETRICSNCDEWMILKTDIVTVKGEGRVYLKWWECPECGGEEDYA